MRYRVDVAYDGSEFHGWQVQPNVRTVQGEIEKALSSILGVKIRINGAGRTDAGVHALQQVFHFDFPRPLDIDRFYVSLNRSLPRDIVVKRITPVDDSFHARFSVKSKTYIYVIHRGTKNPFLSRYTWNYPFFLDIKAMERCAGLIKGDVDFSGFISSVKDLEEKNPVRTIFSSVLLERGEMLIYIIRGISFIKYLVRSIVGTLVRVGKGEVSEEDFSLMVEGKMRKEPIFLAPPSGLYLARIDY